MNVYRSLKWFLSISGFGLKTSVAPQRPNKWGGSRCKIDLIITTFHWVHEQTPFQRGRVLTALETRLSAGVGITSFLLLWALEQRQDKITLSCCLLLIPSCPEHLVRSGSWTPPVVIMPSFDCSYPAWVAFHLLATLMMWISESTPEMQPNARRCLVFVPLVITMKSF